MYSLGTICIFSEDTQLLYEQAAYLTDKNYLVFATPNVYKFVRYTQELQPNLLIVDMDAQALQDEKILAYLRTYRANMHKPVLLLGTHLDRCYRGVAHYLTKPFPLVELEKIVQSYCQGNQQHDVLLVDNCVNKDSQIIEELKHQNLSCFEVSDTNAARYYLLKNKPKCICLNLPYDQCTRVEPKLQHNKIFFVDNYKQVKNLARLI